MRNFKDWIGAYIEYAGYGESPTYMCFWTAVSTIAGCLRRKVWIDQIYFRWFPNFYIIFVAPPGIATKTFTMGLGMDMLRQVPDIKFGPDAVTWQSLVTDFAQSTEEFEYNGEILTMSPMTLESGEFGVLLDPSDKAMVDWLVSLWDGRERPFKKSTKFSGKDHVENPWINMIAACTPSWIAQNVPEYMLGGGFFSRCILVYADHKEKYVPYLSKVIPPGHKHKREKLIEDLIEISTVPLGEYQLTDAAFKWGAEWYESHWKKRSRNLTDETFTGYISRKQTHIHKLAMVLAASSSNEMIITEHHLTTAATMVTDLEPDMSRVFSKIGKSEYSYYADKLIKYIHENGTVTYKQAYRFIHTQFPSHKDFEDILAGLIKAGFIKLDKNDEGEAIIIAIV